MEIYLITGIFLFIFAYLDVAYKLSSSLKFIFITIIYLIMVLQIGLRWETGTDWKSYLDHFESIDDFASTSPIYTGMEYGYSIMVLMVKFFSDSYSILLIFHTIVYYWIIIKGIDQLTPFLFISIMLFYASTMGVMGSNRQLIAVAVVLYSLKFVIDRKIYPFLFCLTVAAIFHTTAIICILFYFINKRFKISSIIIIVFLSIVIGKTSLPMKTFTMLGSLGGDIGSKVVFYLERADSSITEYGVTLSGLVKRILFLSLFLVGREKLSQSYNKYDFLLNGYIVGLVIYFLFSSSLVILVSRGSLYFNVLEPILLGYQFAWFKKKQDKFVILLLALSFSILIFFQSIGQYPELFVPYKGLFINRDYIRYY